VTIGFIDVAFFIWHWGKGTQRQAMAWRWNGGKDSHSILCLPLGLEVGSHWLF
jgi:hypothetical protein